MKVFIFAKFDSVQQKLQEGFEPLVWNSDFTAL